jgi:CRP-like cAMP-binding protein
METAVLKEKFKAGDYIFFEGDIDFHFYVIESGQVAIFTKNEQGHRIDICTVEPGESFGEFALLSNEPRSASAQALTDCTLIKVSPEAYERLMTELPTWASSMLRSFADRLKRLTKTLKGTPQFISKDS